MECEGTPITHSPFTELGTKMPFLSAVEVKTHEIP